MLREFLLHLGIVMGHSYKGCRAGQLNELQGHIPGVISLIIHVVWQDKVPFINFRPSHHHHLPSIQYYAKPTWYQHNAETVSQ